MDSQHFRMSFVSWLNVRFSFPFQLRNSKDIQRTFPFLRNAPVCYSYAFWNMIIKSFVKISFIILLGVVIKKETEVFSLKMQHLNVGQVVYRSQLMQAIPLL